MEEEGVKGGVLNNFAPAGIFLLSVIWQPMQARLRSKHWPSMRTCGSMIWLWSSQDTNQKENQCSFRRCIKRLKCWFFYCCLSSPRTFSHVKSHNQWGRNWDHCPRHLWLRGPGGHLQECRLCHRWEGWGRWTCSAQRSLFALTHRITQTHRSVIWGHPSNYFKNDRRSCGGTLRKKGNQKCSLSHRTW